MTHIRQIGDKGRKVVSERVVGGEGTESGQTESNEFLIGMNPD